MRLSVIMPCFNGARTICTQLEALANQVWSEPWEVIIADNGSTDESLAIVERYRRRLPNLRVVDASDRRGQPHALNTGAQVARGEALAFCDVDDEVGPGWLAALGEALKHDDLVACRIETRKLNPPWVQRRHSQEVGIQQFTYPPFLPHAGSATLGVKRVVHEALGGFDGTLLVLFDTDYCWRAQLSGWELKFVPDAVVHVRHRASLRGIYRQARTWGEYDVLLYKRYRARGMPRLAPVQGIRAWAGLLRALPRIRDKQRFASWLWAFSWRWGRVVGSVKHRVFAL